MLQTLFGLCTCWGPSPLLPSYTAHACCSVVEAYHANAWRPSACWGTSSTSMMMMIISKVSPLVSPPSVFQLPRFPGGWEFLPPPYNLGNQCWNGENSNAAETVFYTWKICQNFCRPNVTKHLADLMGRFCQAWMGSWLFSFILPDVNHARWAVVSQCQMSQIWPT